MNLAVNGLKKWITTLAVSFDACVLNRVTTLYTKQGSILDPILTIPKPYARLFFVFLFYSLNSSSMILEIVSYCISVLYPSDFHKIWINNPHLVCLSW